MNSVDDNFSRPLPPPDHSDRCDSNGHASVSPHISSASIVTLGLSCLIAAGVQFGWALQLSLLTPYVQTLGIEHSFTSFIWLCGPITGLVVQPCVGVWSDKCQLKFGRRRPFILVGSTMICLAVTIIGFAADIGYFLGDGHEGCGGPNIVRPRAIVVFILGFWLLDLANNTVQGPARALLADLAGPEQRDKANAIFCLWMALGNILGFTAGASADWQRVFPFVRTQACCDACGNLKAAFLAAVVFLFFCTVVTVFFAKEAPLVKTSRQHDDQSPLLPLQQEKSVELQGIRVHYEKHPLTASEMNGKAEKEGPEDFENASGGPGAVLVNLLTSMRHLPTEMKSVLVVMALCWLSWFPFFLFDTDWMGREVFHGDPSGADPLKAIVYQSGVRKGAFGLLLNSIVLAVGSFLIDPLCRGFGSKYVWAASNFMIFACMASTSLISALAVRKEGTGSQQTYSYAHGAKVGAVALFALLGLPLAVTYSVPYSITAELASDSGGGQGLAMGILNLAVVVPQMVVALGAGPWDALFGGGNEPSFAFAALFAFMAGIVALLKLPQLARGDYRPANSHGFG